MIYSLRPEHTREFWELHWQGPLLWGENQIGRAYFSYARARGWVAERWRPPVEADERGVA